MAKEFFIGWQDNMPTRQYQFLKQVTITTGVISVIAAGLFAYFQKPVKDFSFQLGKLSKIKGIYYDRPFPFLIADQTDLPQHISNEILLVGYGKFGAESTMNQIQEKVGSLHGKKVELEGTLIYGDGKTLMELSKDEESFIAILDSSFTPSPIEESLGILETTGEILDPKCYFGVMKPGEGKIHKSCAIRCISGGIPPVLRKKSNHINRSYDYYLLLDENGKKVNQLLLQNVGETIKLKGEIQRFMNWRIFYVPRNQFYQ
ncbi:hypothetical protein [Sediminitomix flava]|uniref:Uncharacterized protein n=1 Tax=Sediminitomix flava TaxID=379075 RepID=A0A315ZJ53_SEDFL|nr:hypothetical protein [Sediminitomix flava]PWJ44724.1 hypothetical protein BC781_1011095 [Sediminitomix flava]